MPTDEELASILFDAVWPPHATNYRLNEMPANVQESYFRQARAIRDALEPPVAPLAPGETVTIRDHTAPTIDWLEMSVTDLYLFIDVKHTMPLFHEELELNLALDLAGVRELEATCRRARAALEGDE